MKTINLEDWEIEEMRRIIITAESALAARIGLLEGISESLPEDKELILELRMRIARGDKLFRKLCDAANRTGTQTEEQ